MPRTADLEGDLLVPNAFTAGGVNVLGIKGRKAMDVESLHVGKLLKTSLLDADHTQSGELLTPMLQSPTGKLGAWFARPRTLWHCSCTRRAQCWRAWPA